MRRSGSNDDRGFNNSTRSYKQNPSIENYVSIRRARPEEEVEVAVVGGIDQLFFMEAELRYFGIDPALVASVLDADADAISELSLQLLERLANRNSKRQAGETHLSRRRLAIPDKLVDWLIACALDALSWNDDLYMPRDLIVLIRERLGGSHRAYEQGSRAHEMRGRAAMAAGQLMAQGRTPTFRWLGKVFGVAPSTVKRWFPDGEFFAEARKRATFFDRKGRLKPDLGLSKELLRRK